MLSRYFENWPAHKQTKIDLWEALGPNKVCQGYTDQDGNYHSCGKQFKTIDDTEMDHNNPYDLGMEKGGRTIASNCRLICKSCNSKKNND